MRPASLPHPATDKQPTSTVLFVAGLPKTLELFVAPVAEELRRRGIRCVAAAGGLSNSAILETSFDAVHGLPEFRRSTLRSLARAGRCLVDIARRERVDLIHLHSPYSVALGRIASMVSRTPHVAVIHGTLFDVTSREGRIFTAAERLAARLTRTYVTLNDDDTRTYSELAPKSRVLQASCGGAGLDVAKLNAEAALANRGGGRRKRVLILGRLTNDKNLDLAVAAWRKAKARVPELELRIVGSALPGEDCWSPPDEPGVETESWTDAPGRELAAADVLLSASPREGFSMAVAESLVLGTPVVAVENRGTRTINRVVDRGVFLTEPDADALAEALLRQLAAGRLPPDGAAEKSWGRAAVVAFHANIVEDSLR